MYGVYGVGIPVTGPVRSFEGRSRNVVLVAGALCCGYASRKGREVEGDAEAPGVKFKGVGLERPGLPVPGDSICNRGGTIGGGPGL